MLPKHYFFEREREGQNITGLGNRSDLSILQNLSFIKRMIESFRLSRGEHKTFYQLPQRRIVARATFF